MMAAGFRKSVLQVGHIGLLKALVAGCEAPLETWTALLTRRSPDDLREVINGESISEDRAEALLALAEGKGDEQWIADSVGKYGDDFDLAANELLDLVHEVGDRVEGDVAVYADAAVMPRFLYHSGILFAGFAEGVSQALLHGGRYDAMMKAHGRDMPATGFSCDLWALLDSV